MPHRQIYKRPIPKVWLMTDPRLGDDLLAIVRKLPARSGVVFRHYGLPATEQHRLFMAVRHICRQRGHCLILAGEQKWPADGYHGLRRNAGTGLKSAPVHNVREIGMAKHYGVALVFLSPLYSTRSHIGARPLGMLRFSMLSALTGDIRVIALGGMTRNRAQMLKQNMAYGWAAIDAFRM
jgi:thiamine-phosphate pyrophosphorylase